VFTVIFPSLEMVPIYNASRKNIKQPEQKVFQDEMTIYTTKNGLEVQSP